MFDEKNLEEILREASTLQLIGKPSLSKVYHSSIHTANTILLVIGNDDYTIKNLLEKVGTSLNTTRSFCRILYTLGYLDRERGIQNNKSCWIYRKKNY
jgi:hypothetical protein